MDNDACQCKRCKKNRMDEWPYTRTLSAHILCLTGVTINDINYNEVTKFEESLVGDYLRHISDFWKYLTEICLLAGDNGIEILHNFYHGIFDKPRVHDRQIHARITNVPHPTRKKKIMKYTKQKYMILRKTFPTSC